ncbi:unnamed protein product, partial [Anisakis simplex]|uniref:CG326 n=1 Tax=Anisakis simplex TaxID=6269 RepID=A0A0M3JEM1_ANISI
NGIERPLRVNDSSNEASSSSANNISLSNVRSASTSAGGLPGSSSHSGVTSLNAPKRLFSPSNSTAPCNGNLMTRSSIDSAGCGSEFARSPDDAVYAPHRFGWSFERLVLLILLLLLV